MSSYELSEIPFSKSQLQSCVPLGLFTGSSPQITNCKVCAPKMFSANQVPKSHIAMGVPVRFFGDSSPQISSRNGCPSKISFGESRPPNLKSQRVCPSVSAYDFRESNPQISNRRRCCLKIFEEIKIPNLKLQGVSRKFVENQTFKSQIARGVSMCPPKVLQISIFSNLKLQAMSPQDFVRIVPNLKSRGVLKS